jgi:transcriptional regulator with XRE-family HTH domain
MSVVLYEVKAELARRGLTQTAFAPRVGVKPSSLGQVLNGKVSIWPGLRTRIAAELGIPEEQLFGGAAQ